MMVLLRPWAHFSLPSFLSPTPSCPNLPEQTLSKRRSFTRVCAVSLESLFLLACGAVMKIFEEKYHSKLFSTIQVNILQYKCAWTFNNHIENNGCKTWDIPWHPYFFAPCRMSYSCTYNHQDIRDLCFA